MLAMLHRILGKLRNMKLQTKMSFPWNSLLLIFHCGGNCAINVLYAFTHTRIKPKKTCSLVCFWETPFEHNNCSMITSKLVFKIVNPWIRWVPSRWMKTKGESRNVTWRCTAKPLANPITQMASENILSDIILLREQYSAI